MMRAEFTRARCYGSRAMDVNGYLKKLAQQHAAGDATEHTHRPTLQALLESVFTGVQVTNEPKQIACGAPDFVLTRKRIPLGYIEAKDIGAKLGDAKHQEQFKRYKEALDTLIITNYMEFRLYLNAEHAETVRVAELRKGKVHALRENFSALTDLLETFASHQAQLITSADDLAGRMAQKARMLARTIERALGSEVDAKSEDDSNLQSQLSAFQEHLIHGIKPKEFADVYAQTVAYGMFAARLHDPTPDTFSRKEAAELIPAANPFLRKFFQHIAGYELDERIRWILDDLADIFRSANVGELMADYGKATQRSDPFLHFYETFLGAYDQKLRKSRGVYYTPEPVVHFIVNAVDEILKSEFGLKKGLADKSKTKSGKHKVQILDPASGTGTFLAKIISHIHATYFPRQQGAWPDYVRNELIPRLNGFEILMAPYAMAHIKLAMVLRETGYELDERLRIFLTNALEERQIETPTLPFTQWLATEAMEASIIKGDTPVMVVLGNPPYSGHSANKGPWIKGLIKPYKKEPSGGKLKEQNSKWLNDDYVKFIRYGQHYIDRNGEGVLAYINNHSFLDNPTFRGMRWNLLQSFDKIYVVDLHGNTKKKERSPDGSKDENVFDIQQGVSVNLFVKTGRKRAGEPAEIFHSDSYGHRQSKYARLRERSFGQVKFRKLRPLEPQCFFVPKNYRSLKKYERGFSVNDLFERSSVGIVTARDRIFVQHDKKDFPAALADQGISYVAARVHAVSYRPFDERSIYYDTEKMERPRQKIMQQFLLGENLGLIFKRGGIEPQSAPVFATKRISESRSWSRPGMQGIESVAPLYLHGDGERQPNYNAKIFKAVTSGLGRLVEPMELFDYIYAHLHAPSYRERYIEFLKIDFPRVPYPTDKKLFRKLVKLGGELRKLHLFESNALDAFVTEYPKVGDNTVGKISYKNEKVFINKTQYFAGVPERAWNFYIGGYQPAQKWLKDRKGRRLSADDIAHYQKIIVALLGTERLMKEIDKVIEF